MGIKYRKDSNSEWLEIQGLEGDQGPKGDPGYSPIKGIDYWTNEDKQEIIDEIPPTDLTGYATEEYVSQKIAEAELNDKEVDLSAYYTKSETDIEIDKAVAAIPQPDLSGYATKNEIPTIPTNVGAFANDVGYLTEHQSLDGYALKTEIPSTTGLATEQYVDEKVANVDVDLTGYAKTDDLAKVATSGSYNDLEDLPEGSINVSPVPGGDIWIDTSGGDVIGFADVAFSGDYNHLTNTPDLSDMATEDYVNQRIAEVQASDKDIDLSAYYTKGETRDVINEKLVNYYTRLETEDRIGIALKGYALIDQVESVAGQLDQVKADYTTKEYVDEAVENVEVDLTGYATETYVDEKIAAIPQIDLTNYALKSDIPKNVSAFTNDANYALKSEIPSTTGFITMPEVEAKGYQTEDQVNTLIANAQLADDKEIDLSNYYTKAETRAYVTNNHYTKTVTDNMIANSASSLRTEVANNYAKKSDIPDTSGFTTMAAVEAKGYQTEAQVNALIEANGGGSTPTVDLSNYYTKDEVVALGYQTEAQVLALIQANLPTNAEGVEY